MAETRVTQHYDGDRHLEVKETTRDDGSSTRIVSEVTDTPLGRCGSDIVERTETDRHGNSRTTR